MMDVEVLDNKDGERLWALLGRWLAALWLTFAVTLTACPAAYAVPALTEGYRRSEHDLYDVRPQMSDVSATPHRNLGADWERLKEAKLALLAKVVEMYPDSNIYFLARDAEYIFDLSRVLITDKRTRDRVRLVNLSRLNIKSIGVGAYLEQEGLDANALSTGPEALLVDTGFAGTIPAFVRGRLPKRLQQRLKTLLIVSSDPAIPSSRTFLSYLSEDAVDREIDEMHDSIVSYEHLPRYTNRSTHFVLSEGRWVAVSRRSNSDGESQRDPRAARVFMEDLKDFGMQRANRLRFRKLRSLWRELLELKHDGDFKRLRSVINELRLSGDSHQRAMAIDFFEILELHGGLPRELRELSREVRSSEPLPFAEIMATDSPLRRFFESPRKAVRQAIAEGRPLGMVRLVKGELPNDVQREIVDGVIETLQNPNLREGSFKVLEELMQHGSFVAVLRERFSGFRSDLDLANRFIETAEGTGEVLFLEAALSIYVARGALREDRETLEAILNSSEARALDPKEMLRTVLMSIVDHSDSDLIRAWHRTYFLSGKTEKSVLQALKGEIFSLPESRLLVFFDGLLGGGAGGTQLKLETLEWIRDELMAKPMSDRSLRLLSLLYPQLTKAMEMEVVFRRSLRRVWTVADFERLSGGRNGDDGSWNALFARLRSLQPSFSEEVLARDLGNQMGEAVAAFLRETVVERARLEALHLAATRTEKKKDVVVPVSAAAFVQGQLDGETVVDTQGQIWLMKTAGSPSGTRALTREAARAEVIRESGLSALKTVLSDDRSRLRRSFGSGVTLEWILTTQPTYFASWRHEASKEALAAWVRSLVRSGILVDGMDPARLFYDGTRWHLLDGSRLQTGLSSAELMADYQRRLERTWGSLLQTKQRPGFFLWLERELTKGATRSRGKSCRAALTGS